MPNTVNLSLNELEGLSKRAARGAGYSWGLCEEAAKAARCLCVHGLDGAGQLAALLQSSLASSPSSHRPGTSPSTGPSPSTGTSPSTGPDTGTPIWQSNSHLCPLATGAYLSDSAELLRTEELEIRQVACPTLLLPFVVNVAQLSKQIISIQCNDIVATTDGSGIDITKAFASSASDVFVRTGGSFTNSRAQQNRVVANRDCLEVLTRYADLTYAPATEESRLAGAGAGLSDND